VPVRDQHDAVPVRRPTRDSGRTAIELGRATIAGGPGATVTLSVKVDSRFLDMLPRDALVTIELAGNPIATHPLYALTNTVEVYSFRDQETVQLRYTLSRNIKVVPVGAFELFQSVTGARVLSATRPWMKDYLQLKASSSANLTTTASGCEITAATTTCDGITATVNPYVPKNQWAPNFSSDITSHASSTITIDFSAAINTFAVTVYDPDYPQNEVRALDANGATIASVQVPGDGIGGVLTAEPVNISVSGIRKILLIPGAADYLEYGQATFSGGGPELTCAPSPVFRGQPVTCLSVRERRRRNGMALCRLAMG
jgi:hypothetical protein